MYKLLVFVFTVIGCNAGVLHRGYTAHIQSSPVIQQYLTEEHVVPVAQQQFLSYAAPTTVVESPLVYAAPVVKKQASKPRQLQTRKQKIDQPAPESFSYQIRVQHAENPQHIEEIQEQPEPVPQIQPLVQHYEYQPLQTYQFQQIQLEEPQPVQKPRAQIRRPQKLARTQVQPPPPQTKAKNADLATVQLPQIGDIQYTYTPVVYYFQDVNAGRRVYKRPVQPQPQPEEEEEEQQEGGLETLERYEAEDNIEDDYESEIVVARVQPKQQVSRSHTAPNSAQLNVNGVSYDSPLLAYQSFNAGW